MFRNVPESQAEGSASRIADDTKLVLEITKVIGVDRVEVVNAVRLGQRKNKGFREKITSYKFNLVILILRDILSKAKKLAS